MQNERRSKKRIKISYYVPIINAESFEQLGILSEITTKGLQVDSQKKLSSGETYKLRLDLTDEAFGQPFITFTAQARWIRPDRIEPNFYNIGFEMLELSVVNQTIIEKIMERYTSGNSSK